VTRNLRVIVPTRERPRNAARLLKAFESTIGDDTRVIFAVDEDDPKLGDYLRLDAEVRVRPTKTMVDALNRTALEIAGVYFALGFMGDDHLPRTKSWDVAYLDYLEEVGVGIVYGNDLLQGDALPTQCAMTANIVTVLGQMAPPQLSHLYVDDYWLALGTRTGCICYMQGVQIEHMHPGAGKAVPDSGYARVNGFDVTDKAAWSQYQEEGRLDADVLQVKMLQKFREPGE
jgi:hypothetical protein